MSNCSHYYGDIPEKKVYFQNQILDHWSALPFNLFSFNFGNKNAKLSNIIIIININISFLSLAIGATHIIHHYVPGQPFYIRQLVFWDVKKMMVENGVRNNDLDIVNRANRYFHTTDDSKAIEATIHGDERIKAGKQPKNMHRKSWWFPLFSTFGYASYLIFDCQVLLAFLKRVYVKYLAEPLTGRNIAVVDNSVKHKEGAEPEQCDLRKMAEMMNIES